MISSRSSTGTLLGKSLTLPFYINTFRLVAVFHRSDSDSGGGGGGCGSGQKEQCNAECIVVEQKIWCTLQFSSGKVSVTKHSTAHQCFIAEDEYVSLIPNSGISNSSRRRSRSRSQRKSQKDKKEANPKSKERGIMLFRRHLGLRFHWHSAISNWSILL